MALNEINGISALRRQGFQSWANDAVWQESLVIGHELVLMPAHLMVSMTLKLGRAEIAVSKVPWEWLAQRLSQETCGPDFLAGISVSSELLDLMALRYSDSAGRVSFPSLVCFLMRLEAMASKCPLGTCWRPSQRREAQERTRGALLPQPGQWMAWSSAPGALAPRESQR